MVASAIALGLTALTTGVSMHESTMNKKTAKGEAFAEQQRIAEENRNALDTRIEGIDKQRRQIGAGSKYETNSTGQTGTFEGLLG